MSNLEENKVATRYARALFEAASEAGTVEVIERELIHLDETFQKVPGLLNFLVNPAIPIQERMTFAEKQIASKVNPWVGNLVKLMTENHRIGAFSKVVNHFCLLINKRDNVTSAEVITAVELDAKQADQLREKLEKLYGYSKVNIENRVDPGILGGAVVKIQDRVIDGSFVGKLEQLRKHVSV